MRLKHRVEFDIFLKRRKARIAAAAAAAAAASQSQGQQQMAAQAAAAQAQYFQAQQQAALAAQLMHQQQQYGGNQNQNNDQFQHHLARYAAALQQQQQQQQQTYHQMQHQGQSQGQGHPNLGQGHPNLSLPIGMPNYGDYYGNMMTYLPNNQMGTGRSVSPSPSVSPGPPTASSPVPQGDHGYPGEGPIDSPNEVSAKSGPGSSPDTPTRSLGSHHHLGSGGGQGVELGSSSPYGFASSPYGAFRPVISSNNGGAHHQQFHPAPFPSYYLQPHHAFMGGWT